MGDDIDLLQRYRLLATLLGGDQFGAQFLSREGAQGQIIGKCIFKLFQE